MTDIPPPPADKPLLLEVSPALSEVIVELDRQRRRPLPKNTNILGTLASRHGRDVLGYSRADLVRGAAFLLLQIEDLDLDRELGIIDRGPRGEEPRDVG